MVNDTLNGKDTVAVYERTSNLTAGFGRKIDDQVLTFSQADEAIHMVDGETRTTWNKLDDVAIDGPLEGRQLTMIPSFQLLWFAWTDFYPDTTIYGK